MITLISARLLLATLLVVTGTSSAARRRSSAYRQCVGERGAVLVRGA
jgi:hypothetical protein